MKITIDTANDSKEELRKLITLLQSLVEEKPKDVFSESESTPSDGMFNMFGDQPDNSTDDGSEETTFKIEEY